MKTVNMRDARDNLAELVDEAQKEPIVLTKHGKPVVILTGVEGADLAR
jgi:prevent-host-death family protein